MTVLFGAAIFGAAALVFLVQPMIAKAILPTFGGTPQVWNASLVFFQAALLAGYGYAHLSSVRLGPRRQPILHLAVLVLPLAVLPIALRGLGLVENLPPAPAVVAILAVSVGLPYVVISSTSPLLQRWFSTTGHRHAADPYFLYAAGNAGSLLGLLAYPFVIEPRLTLLHQTWLWSAGYVVVALLIAACALATRQGRNPDPDVEAPALPTAAALPEPTAADVEVAGEPVTPSRRLRWIAWAALPSSLLLGVTTHLQTDIAAVPLLWVMPLTLYLVTFVLAFSRVRVLRPAVAGTLLPFLAAGVAATLMGLVTPPIWLSMLLHYVTFFVAAMLAHGRLAEDRPHPRHLTEYFFLIAVGGVLGGAFNALVAPVVFNRVIEYPLALVLVLLVRPAARRAADERAARRARLVDVLVALGAYLVTLVGLVVVGSADLGRNASLLVLAAVLAFSLVAIRRPVRQAGIVAAALAVVLLAPDGALFVDRTFFGVNRVIEDADGRHVYVSGLTVHGLQHTDAARADTPLGYYHPTGPAGQVLETAARGGSGRQIALIGLGAGALAAYAEPGDRYTFYEIDPVVVQIARDERLFSFLSNSPAEIDVVEGDGRLRLAEAEPGAYDVIVLDAFSSDAVPAHLLTLEAVALYLEKLRPGGMLLFHVTNSYLDVRAVVAGAARAADLAGMWRSDRSVDAAPPGDKEPSEWVVVAPAPDALASLEGDPGWTSLIDVPRSVLWTDDFSDVIGVLR